MEKLTVKIDGMSCGMCDAHVNNLVRKHFNVKKVKANHSKGIAEIITEDNISDEAAIDDDHTVIFGIALGYADETPIVKDRDRSKIRLISYRQ